MRIFLRVLAYLLIISGVVGVWFAPTIPLVSKPENPRSSVEVEPKELVAACPGSLVQVGGEDGTDLGNLDRIGEPRVNVVGAELLDPTQWMVFRASGSPQSTALLSANQLQSAKESRVRGLAATSCQKPQSSGYFANGNSGPGVESVLLLGNPNQVEVFVDLTVYLSSGISTERVTLRPMEQSILPLIGLAAAESNYGVSFQTSGMPISVYLQQRSVEGLTATGLDLTPALKANIDSFIPGVEIESEGFEPVELRLFNPAFTPAKASVSILTASGQIENKLDLEIEAGQVVSELLELSAGSFVISVSADQPIVSSARNTVLEPTLDFAWLVPAELFQDSVTIPNSSNATLLLFNPGTAGITVVLGSQSFTLPSKNQVRVPVEAKVLEVFATGEVVANLELKTATGYAVISPMEMKNFGEEVAIVFG